MTDVSMIDLHGILPQGEPFVMVGRMLSFDMKRVVTSTVVAGDNLLVEGGHFSAAGLMENMAQTCAVRMGYINKYILMRGVRPGFIGAIRSFRAVRLPEVGETMVTTVEVQSEVFGLSALHATVRVGDEVIAEADMKLAESGETIPVQGTNAAASAHI